MNSLVLADELRWQRVPGGAIQLYEKLAAPVTEIHQAIHGLPREGFLDLWLDACENRLILNADGGMSKEALGRWRAVLEPCCATLDCVNGVDGPDSPTWIKVAFTWRSPSLSHSKEAYSPTLRFLGQAGGFFPSKWLGKIPGVPSPLAAMIASGLLGAGTGYGAGWLAEKMLPQDWKRNRLRRTLAVLGGLGGVGLGGLWAGANVSAGRHWNDPALLNHPPVPNIPRPKPELTEALAAAPGEVPAHIKQAWGRTGLAEMQLLQGHSPPIDVFSLANSLSHPAVVAQMPAPVRVATGAIVGGASHLRGGARIVWPTDIARIGVGMGSGYMSGLLVGKIMGALTGMPPKTQERLRETGIWAGILSNIVPMMFG